MHKTPLSHASRIFSASIAAVVLLVLTGCNFTITNLTPTIYPQNPSQIYTITARFQPTSNSIDSSSISHRIVIDGSSYKMTKSVAGTDVWEFDYQIPAGRTGATYYFICDYSVVGSAAVTEINSDLQSVKIAGRYLLRSEASRAPVGSRVSVLGAGFT